MEYDQVELDFDGEALKAAADRAVERGHRRPRPAGRAGGGHDQGDV